ncbi:MAG: DUF4345 domain-containing protein [Flammeovirgaceae bacterium]
MNSKRTLNVASVAFLAFSAVAILAVSLMAFNNPQHGMDMVQVQLPNTDAYSSIRGIYGGVGFTIFLTLVYLTIKDHLRGLNFAAVLWGFYAISRVITIFSEGALGAFGTQWLTIETLLCLMAILLLFFHSQKGALARNESK